MAEFGPDMEQLLRRALDQVREPTGKSLLEAGWIVGVRGDDAVLTVVCKDVGLPPPIKERISREIKQSVQNAVPQAESVQVEWETEDAAEAEAPSGPKIKHVIAVGSGKGGVGKSTIAASLTYALQLRGKRVGLMDADVYGPSIPHMLGVSGRPTEQNGRLVVPEVDGIKVMSMGFLVAPDQAVVWRGPMLHKAVSDFLHMVDWGALDFLIVDLPPGTGDVVLSLSQQMSVSGGVIVCTPQDVALLDARKALSMLGTVKIPCLGIVENMSYFECPSCNHRSEIFGHGGAKRWASEVNIPFLGGVPINLQVRLNGDEGHVRDNFAADNPVRESLLGVADRLIEQLGEGSGPAAPTLEIVG